MLARRGHLSTEVRARNMTPRSVDLLEAEFAELPC